MSGHRAARREAAHILGVPIDASEADIKTAWLAAARHHHPDTGGDPDRFAAARHAYELLVAGVCSGEHDWPDEEHLPEGALWVEVDARRGLAWDAVVYSPEGIDRLGLFTMLGHRFETLVVDPGPLENERGRWHIAPDRDDFWRAARRCCRTVCPSAWWVAPMPPTTAPASRWSMRELDDMCALDDLHPDVETMQAVARRLETLDRITPRPIALHASLEYVISVRAALHS